jgi:hypothetical protein
VTPSYVLKKKCSPHIVNYIPCARVIAIRVSNQQIGHAENENDGSRAGLKKNRCCSGFPYIPTKRTDKIKKIGRKHFFLKQVIRFDFHKKKNCRHPVQTKPCSRAGTRANTIGETIIGAANNNYCSVGTKLLLLMEHHVCRYRYSE